MKIVILMLIFLPISVFSQNTFTQFPPQRVSQTSDISVYDNIPNGYRVFSLPIPVAQTRGLQNTHRIDVYATFNKKGKTSALLAELKSVSKNTNINSIPLVVKSETDDDWVTVLLLQNIQVLYVPNISYGYAGDYPELGIAITDEAKEKQITLAKNVMIRLLLTPEESQVSAYASAVEAKFSLVIRSGEDTEKKNLLPLTINELLKAKP